MGNFIEDCFDQAAAAMLITDEQGKIIAVNQALIKMSGYAPDRLIGATPALLKSNRQTKDSFASLWQALVKAKQWNGEIWNKHSSGRLYAVQATISGVTGPEQTVSHYIAVYQDVTAEKRDEERARRMLHADPLTGLPNQTLFIDRLERICARYRREKRPAAIIIADLNGFKAINDTFGFDAGDELLREMARRLKGAVRDSDTVTRLQGDRFGLILPDLAHQRDITLIARKLISVLSDTYHLGHHERAFVSVSLGIANIPEDSLDAGDLSRFADLALDQAKTAGRNMYRFYSKALNSQAVERLHFERDLHDAILKHQFELHYQPIVSTQSGRVAGAEALIRWNRPGHGLVAPLDFLPLAEETGLIVPIGDWVLQEVGDILIANSVNGSPPLQVSVNISPRQLRDSDVFDRVRQRLEAAKIASSSLVLEISESAMVDITSAEESVLNKVTSFGIGLSIDNYGNGYTSLQHLRRMAVKTLKIDKVVVRKLGADASDAALTDAILAMARSLGISTIADGIENDQQWQHMQQRQCEFGQGFLFSTPLNRQDFLAYLRAQYSKVG